MHKSTDYRIKIFLKDAKYQTIWPVIYINDFIFNKEFQVEIYFKTNKMSTQKDTKTPDTKGEKSGNITAYSKSKLSGKVADVVVHFRSATDTRQLIGIDALDCRVA